MIHKIIDIAICILAIVVVVIFLNAMTGSTMTISNLEYVPTPEVVIEPNDPNATIDGLKDLEWRLAAQQSMIEQGVHMARKK